MKPARVTVLASPALRVGGTVEITGPTVLGREASAGVRLDEDDFVSARHARIEPRLDGAWVEDLGSTNGTFVNGARLEDARRLQPADVVRVGSTELRLEQ